MDEGWGSRGKERGEIKAIRDEKKGEASIWEKLFGR